MNKQQQERKKNNYSFSRLAYNIKLSMQSLLQSSTSTQTFESLGLSLR